MTPRVFFAALSLLSGPAIAAVAPGDPTIIPLFEAACARGDLSFAAREAAISGDPAWVAVAVPDADVSAFQLVPINPVSLNFDYHKPLLTKQWNRVAGDRTIRVVLAQFETKRRYPNLCGIVVADVAETAMSYIDEFERVAKSVGLKGKSVDLVHYFEFSGKLADGRPARADIFSRSQVLGRGTKTMHLYVAF